MSELKLRPPKEGERVWGSVPLGHLFEEWKRRPPQKAAAAKACAVR